MKSKAIFLIHAMCGILYESVFSYRIFMIGNDVIGGFQGPLKAWARWNCALEKPRKKILSPIMQLKNMSEGIAHCLIYKYEGMHKIFDIIPEHSVNGCLCLISSS